MQWSLTAVEVEGQRLGVIVARLMTGDFVEARNRAESFSKGDLFSRWMAALGQLFTLTTLRESGLSVNPSGVTDVIVARSLRVRTRLSSFARPATQKIPLATLLQRFRLLGPRCTEDGEILEEPADFYAQVIVAMSTDELKQLLLREVGAVSVVLAGAVSLPKILEKGTPQLVGKRWFLTLPLTEAIPAADLPIYLREVAAQWRLRAQKDDWQ
ncbi:hypothetical protein Q2T83_02340 [Fervidibacter sacchari]|uniref:Uncharacterized protein n=1 Tax=Candidatus Fervidibacter sacchari TaxID=1448929 RepID=A0ABT2ERQ7_9BACT|nr:hypothetical protein [Candidatus Fervidibacter sacchari]MCS3920096.1 hypothetical protein [Candidatus Fervidibacter sacchari]WKU16673.1 hypothetical protein Q2T83_02340 [Candidatus Fervidibacter sacchari]